MGSPSMGEAKASPQRAAARGPQAAARRCLLKPCGPPEPAIRCPVGFPSPPINLPSEAKGKGKDRVQGKENHQGRRGRRTVGGEIGRGMRARGKGSPCPLQMSEAVRRIGEVVSRMQNEGWRAEPRALGARRQGQAKMGNHVSLCDSGGTARHHAAAAVPPAACPPPPVPARS
jgi:hypothetical protein